MSIDPFLARIMLTIFMVLMVFGLMELVFAFEAGNASVLPETSVYLAFVLLALIFLSYQIRSQSMRDS